MRKKAGRVWSIIGAASNLQFLWQYGWPLVPKGVVALVLAILLAVYRGNIPWWAIPLLAAGALLLFQIAGVGIHELMKRRATENAVAPENIGEPAAKSQTIKQGDVEDSNTLANQGTIQGNVHVGDVHHAPPSPTLNAPTVTITVEGRCCVLRVTNNDVAEPFLVEVSSFVKDANVIKRPPWDDGVEVRTLKRGETAAVMILCLEPDRPNTEGRPYISIIESYALKAWQERVDKKFRLVRFYGRTNQDLHVPDNTGGYFVLRVLSDRHKPFAQRYSYGVTERCRLQMPFDQQEIERENAAGKARDDTALEQLRAMLEQYAPGDQEPEIKA